MAVQSDGFELHTEGPAGVIVAQLFDEDHVAHGFSTRLGGVAEEPCASLTFGTGGQSEQQARTNLARLGLRIGFDVARLYRVRQVHGTDVVVLEQAGADPEEVALLEADALVTNVPGLFLGVQTADCVPVLFYDDRRKVVAAAHAGWRGIVAGVVERTLEAMNKRFEVRPEDVRAAVGPSIGPDAYEVDDDVAAQFDMWPGAVKRAEGKKPHLDLRLAVRTILEQQGLAGDRVAVTDLSTDSRPDLFFSYRVQGPQTGRHLNVIGLSE